MTDAHDGILLDWRLWQEAQGLSERTISERLSIVRRLLEHAGAAPLELSPADIIRFVGAHGGQTTKATYHATIRAYCQWLVRVQLRADDPSLLTPTPKRTRGKPRPIPTGNLELLLASATRRRTRMMILLAAAAGLRVHEIAKFHGEDLDRRNGIITVTGKGGATAMIPAHEAITELAVHFPVDGYWFASYELQGSDRPHVSRAAVYRAIADTMRRAGVVGTPHQLRHWYGTTLLENGVHMRVVQELLRHKSVATTELYTGVSWGLLQAGIAQLQLPDKSRITVST
ncbi:integrase/recombinase XerD [Microbacteriaceae bacterium SG_E_30_P1]|uniref:Integrase/recombinase XerD n=1 Tax=Antiquaquibacter oligotrophicus TaxID=2880260 RepID=A0ABT6KRH9_9MICO|nr:tyrosine-type recombinase/integrase [Antiquaquibacter oligotrophicus]MDH6181802.1 integrase/recombinase XerD [Antiquaquibacter oligotrophicus]UDF12519.1 tyrosine-type recombinase/integrase [Antiquaquibacter oligotrophicus]